MTVVILGHTGFLGSSIHNYLKQNDFSVLGASSKECNLLQPNQITRYFASVPDPVQVVFCAGITRTLHDSFESMLQNIQMVRNVFGDIIRNQVVGLIYLSSVDVYGYSPLLPITEQSLVAPTTFYGMGKLCGEYLLNLPQSLNCPVTILRLPGIYGPSDGGHSIIGKFLQRMYSYDHVTICGDGSVKRDYVEISDACEVIHQLLKAPYSGVLNLATGKSVTIHELIDILSESTNLSPEIEYLPSDQAVAKDLVFDVKLLRSVFPGLVFKSLQEGIVNYTNSNSLH